MRSVPVLGRQTKKARQILADLSGYLAKPNQRHWWSGNNYDQNFIVPPQPRAKLTIFCTVLQELICVDNRSRHVVHRQPLCHRLAANAFVSFGFAQSLAIHKDRFGLLDPLKAKAILMRSEEHTSELQSPDHLVCRLLLEKKKK